MSEGEEKLKWLPHYSIKDHTVFFMNSVNTDIAVPEELSALIEAGSVFTSEEIEKTANRVVLSRLMNEGVIVKLKNYNSMGKMPLGRALAIQPHCDDLALSCGGTLARLKFEQGFDIHCITVFGSYTKESFPWKGEVCMEDDSYTLLRKEEDLLAFQYFNGKVEFLPYRDAAQRGTALNFIFRDGIFKKDLPMVSAITADLGRAIQSLNPEILLMPSAIGWHYDHRIVHTAVLNALSDQKLNVRVYMYEDYPYCDGNRYSYWGRLKEIRDSFQIEPFYSNVSDFIGDKAVMINFYKSQLVHWNYDKILRTVKELAQSTIIEAEFQNHSVSANAVLAERLWKLSEK
ncbi:PIG-L deacetylase family protein [Pseudobacteroides cellulosolvens]|uniref:LmbE family protein n=1 Tax=Pseudobacteroides cellulosolvens ATCC 35603 = DSM 2933 TaxID=398512 RepID=A0A0L6JL14_9FIRM|nr:PIG-L family deacetylase [Pseudobacteroides cellulosolvens]KNY26435.1 LmbE family protein [Pseudobacteroides cellulosolvens ATCC 35603 = DSM 2933]